MIWVFPLLLEMQQKSGSRFWYNGFTKILQIIIHLSRPTIRTYWNQWESWQLITGINDEGDGLTLCEWLSHKVMTTLIRVMLVLVLPELTTVTLQGSIVEFYLQSQTSLLSHGLHMAVKTNSHRGYDLWIYRTILFTSLLVNLSLSAESITDF
jgi:hypothetical protein